MSDMGGPSMPTLMLGAAAEASRKMRSIEELQRDFSKRKTGGFAGQAARVNSQHTREALLAARHASLPRLEGEFLGNLKIRCVSVKSALGCRPKSAKYSQDPGLDDERLLASLEEREAREAGADLKNEETFGIGATEWTFEDALEANAKLLDHPFGSQFGKTADHCASTASGSCTQSDGSSSDGSTPRAMTSASASTLPWTLNPDAAPFVPSKLNADAAPFSPAAATTFQ